MKESGALLSEEEAGFLTGNTCADSGGSHTGVANISIIDPPCANLEGDI